MAYGVRLTRRAELDLVVLYSHINAEHSEPALLWYRDLRGAILSLGRNPNRGSIFQKSRRLRQLMYGHRPHTCRILYRILEKQHEVEVLHIRHGARRKPKMGRLN